MSHKALNQPHRMLLLLFTYISYAYGIVANVRLFFCCSKDILFFINILIDRHKKTTNWKCTTLNRDKPREKKERQIGKLNITECIIKQRVKRFVRMLIFSSKTELFKFPHWKVFFAVWFVVRKSSNGIFLVIYA